LKREKIKDNSLREGSESKYEIKRTISSAIFGFISPQIVVATRKMMWIDRHSPSDESNQQQIHL